MNLRHEDPFPPPSRFSWPQPLQSNKIRRRRLSPALSLPLLPLLASPMSLVLPLLLPLPLLPAPPLPRPFLPLWIWMGLVGFEAHLPSKSVAVGRMPAFAPTAGNQVMIWPPVRVRPGPGRLGAPIPASLVPGPPSPTLRLPLAPPSSQKTTLLASRSLVGWHYSPSPPFPSLLPLSPCS